MKNLNVFNVVPFYPIGIKVGKESTVGTNAENFIHRKKKRKIREDIC